MVLVLGGIGPANTWSHMVDKIIARFEHGEARERNWSACLETLGGAAALAEV